MFSFIVLTFTFEEIENNIFEKYGICSVIWHLNRFFKKKRKYDIKCCGSKRTAGFRFRLQYALILKGLLQ